MKTERISVIFLLSILVVIVSSCHCEKMYFRCDEIEASFGKLEDTLIELNDVYCSVTDFYVNYTTQVDCDVYPTHRANVRVIKFFNSHMLYVPNGLFRYFREVRDFDISKSEVIDIHRNSFEGAIHLIYLTMSNNNITELGASLFMDATSLFVLDLSYNNISKIDKYAFVDARSLSRLSLSYNRITNLHQDLFRDMAYLDQIFLNDNNIEIIHPLQFENNYQLTKVCLDNNKLHRFDTDMFKTFKYLEILQLGGNFLSFFNSSNIEVHMKLLILSKNNLTDLIINNVEVLEASNNNLSSITFTGRNIKQLILSNNSITNIDKIVTVESLESLDLSFNNLGKLNIPTFSKLKKLTYLNLGYTGISHIDFGTFASQTELKVLDISYNYLQRINFDIFSPYLLKLEKLFIEGNGLTEIPDATHVMSIFPMLNTIGLSNNFFNCTYLSGLLRAFTKFKIRLNLDPYSNNSIINSTHVDGILCSNYFNRTKSITPMKHSWLQLQSDENSATFDHNYDEMVGRSDMQHSEITHLRSQITDTKLHEQLLQSNLSFMKGLTAMICFIALIYVSFKLVSLYLQQRNIQLANPNLYRSTTTMNTLESQLEVA